MTKSTHTHKGNCQFCGSVQALNNDTRFVAKHGYTVEYSYFNGTCPGSDARSLQQSRSMTDKLINDLAKEATTLFVLAADYDAGRVLPETISRSRYVKGAGMETYMIPFADGETFEKEAAVKIASVRASNRARSLTDYAKMMTKLTTEVHGKDFIPVKKTAPICTGTRFNQYGCEWEVIRLESRGYTRRGTLNSALIKHVSGNNTTVRTINGERHETLAMIRRLVNR